jgi:polysaccharide export outer membrane protein
VRSLASPSLLLASLVIATAPLAAQSAARGAAAVTDTTVVLHPGDVVKVTVWRNPEMSGDFVVGVNGALRHPLYQEVPVAGVPLQVVESRLKQFLAKYQTDPQIVVEPLFRVMVGGEVRQPNLLSLPRSTTIAEAVALAGGPTTDGRLDNVTLMRDGRRYKFDLTSPNTTWARAPVRSGDVIIIARRGHFFRDVILPLVGVAGSVASIWNLARQ